MRIIGGYPGVTATVLTDSECRIWEMVYAVSYANLATRQRPTGVEYGINPPQLTPREIADRAVLETRKYHAT